MHISRKFNEHLRLKGECPIFSLPSDRLLYILLIFVYTLCHFKNIGTTPYMLLRKSPNDTLWSTFTSVWFTLPHALEQWLRRSISLQGRASLRNPPYPRTFRGLSRIGIATLLQTPCPAASVSVGSLPKLESPGQLRVKTLAGCSPATLCAEQCPAGPGFPQSDQLKDHQFCFVKISHLKLHLKNYE